ncbi:hypothetical protein HPB48_008044 [Haemaphysalis longicornis]|uniref:Synaptic vesicle protein n=1 Tax=Haemaphysalis longicornis TaxID=44386 RepID=A0A9J6FYI8_HAELO|nr:hypothetical protein HPB48_008044 [Haemaphysalis longicornis]
MKRDEDSESASLVGRENPGSYTEDARPTPHVRETDYVDTDVPLLSQFHEDAIAQASEGLFQWLVFLVCGLSLAADSIEIMVIAYVLPSAERELCMDDTRKGWLDKKPKTPDFDLALSYGGKIKGSMTFSVHLCEPGSLPRTKLPRCAAAKRKGTSDTLALFRSFDQSERRDM